MKLEEIVRVKMNGINVSPNILSNKIRNNGISISSISIGRVVIYKRKKCVVHNINNLTGYILLVDEKHAEDNNAEKFYAPVGELQLVN